MLDTVPFLEEKGEGVALLILECFNLNLALRKRREVVLGCQLASSAQLATLYSSAKSKKRLLYCSSIRKSSRWREHLKSLSRIIRSGNISYFTCVLVAPSKIVSFPSLLFCRHRIDSCLRLSCPLGESACTSSIRPSFFPCFLF